MVSSVKHTAPMTAYGVEYLRRLLDGVNTFQSAFDKWMITQVESDHMSSRGLVPTAWPREDADSAEVQRLELDLAEGDYAWIMTDLGASKVHLLCASGAD